jgi:hypothetical protein
MDVPHAMLDINRGCDVRCLACYNSRPPENKSIGQIAGDLDALLRLRRLHTATIAGGEPLLHPDLDEVIQMAANRGLRVALATNAQRLDAQRAASLAAAGLTLALLHIDAGQIREDLTDPMDRTALRTLRTDKFAILHNHGIHCGMLSTVFGNRPDDVADTIDLLLDIPSLRYLVFTGHADFPKLGEVSGSLEKGLKSGFTGGGAAFRQTTNAMCGEFMRDHFNARPFAVLPSRGAMHYDAWLSYHAVAAYQDGLRVDQTFLSSSLVERAGIRALRALHGRYSFFHDESSRAQRIQLVLNAVSGGRLPRNAQMLRHAMGGRDLVSKHIVFQQGPTPDASGELSVCRDCPDAAVVNGQLLPVCLSDRIRVER